MERVHKKIKFKIKNSKTKKKKIENNKYGLLIYSIIRNGSVTKYL